MVLYSSSKFKIIKLGANIQSLRIVDLGFWQISKQIYRKLEFKDKPFKKYQGLSRFPKKLILYWWTKFDILQPCPNF